MTLSEQIKQLRKELKSALIKDNWNEEGPNVEKVLDKFMEHPSSLLNDEHINDTLDELLGLH